MNYYYYNDFPLSIAKGGKEEQLTFVADLAKSFYVNVYNIHEEQIPSPSNDDTIHFFGDTPLFLHTINLLEGSGSKPKTVISPNFYRRNSLFYRVLKILPKKIPTWFSERLMLYKKVDLIIVNSDYEKQYLIKIFGKSISRKIKIIYNTFKINKSSTFVNPKKQSEFYLCVSHISERKNIFELIKSSEIIYKKFKLKLVIAGGLRFNNSKLAEKFLMKVNNKSCVEYKGHLNKEQLDSLYKTCKFHILPSFIESPGISNLEALSYNKKIIVGDFPILKEYFYEEAYYTKFSSKEIAKTIEKLLKSGDFYSSYDLSKFSPEKIGSEYFFQFKSLYER